MLASGQHLIRSANRVLVLTGAGISADSGVPTFRGPRGMWRRHRPEDLATPEAFARDPGLVWEWYAWRRRLVGSCRPNQAHIALARFCRCREGVMLVTQNVDGLHLSAAQTVASEEDGSSIEETTTPLSDSVLELHGNLFRVRCTECGCRYDEVVQTPDPGTGDLPRCCECDALLRPDVVWFGEALDETVLRTAWSFAAAADVGVVIGTSAIVHPAAALADLPLQGGGAIVEVNAEETALTSRATLSLRGKASVLVPQLLDAI